MGTLAHKKILHSPVFIKIAESVFWWIHTTSKWVDQAQTSSLKTVAQYFLSARIQLQAKSTTRRNFDESPVHHEPTHHRGSVGSRNKIYPKIVLLRPNSMINSLKVLDKLICE